MKRIALVAAGLGVALTLTACSNDSDNATTTTTTASSASGSASANASAPALDLSRYGALPAVPTPAATTVTCTYPAAARPASKSVQPPSTTGVPADGTATVTLTTNQGPIGLNLDRAAAPCTVNSFVSLAQQGYFDGTPCHRLSTNPGLQMLQCGDPSGKGSGGPGYEFANEYPTTAYAANDAAAKKPLVYPRGTIAMANAGPDTNGSQFFLVYADSVLPPQYTVFGTMTDEGLATVEKIAAAGDDGSSPAGGGAPVTPVTIESAK